MTGLIYLRGFQKIDDFTYRCQRGWGMLDGVSCSTKVNEAYWLRIREDRRIILMHNLAGAGLPKNEDVTHVGMNDHFVIAQTMNHNWYLFDHRDELLTKWQTPEGPFTKESIYAHSSAAKFPKMKRTRPEGWVTKDLGLDSSVNITSASSETPQKID